MNSQSNAYGASRAPFALPPSSLEATTHNNENFSIATFNFKSDAKPKPETWSRSDLYQIFSTTDIRSSKDGPLFSPATFDPPIRRNANVKHISMLVGDIDHQVDLDVVYRKVEDLKCEAYVHSTHSHDRVTSSNPNAEKRLRLIIPLNSPVSPAEFPLLWKEMNERLGGVFDEQAKDLARMYYLPAAESPNAPSEFKYFSGELYSWQFSAEVTIGVSTTEEASNKFAADEYSEFLTHDERHKELCNKIMRLGQQNGRGNYEMKCPAHNGKTSTSLVYITETDAVKCLKGCTYFDILSAIGLSNGRLSSGTADSSIEDGTSELRMPPVPHADCFYGLAGDAVRMLEQRTEADPMAILIQMLAVYGVIIGRNAYYQVEANKHFLNIFAVLMGGTGSGRKGTSLERVKAIFKGLDEYFDSECMVSGLASGEGLLYQLRDAPAISDVSDGRRGGGLPDEGVDDKRLFVSEGEFAQVLRVQGREGNTLSTNVRNLWDSGDARTMTRTAPLRVTGGHLAIVGHITQTELRICLNRVEASNGYANRFLWVYVARSRFLPNGADVPESEMAQIRKRLERSIGFGSKIGRIVMTQAASRQWENIYRELETSRSGYVALLTQRASPYVLRLAAVFALLDEVKEIDVPHLRAALAIWKYCEDSVKYVFGDMTGDNNADTILAALRQEAKGLNRTEIAKLFNNNKGRSQIQSALQLLHEQNLATCEKVAPVSGTRLVELWFARGENKDRYFVD